MSGSSISLPALSGNDRRRLRTEGALFSAGGNVYFTAELLSAIINLVCPECGGPMGGRSKEFKCRGLCEKDWRPEWECLRVREVCTAAHKRPAQIEHVRTSVLKKVNTQLANAL